MVKAPRYVVERFRKRLNALMDERGHDPDSLAHASGVSESAIRNLLEGPQRSLPTLWTAVLLARGLQLSSVDALLGATPIEGLRDT